MRAPECCAVLRDEKVPVPRRHAALTTTRLFKVNGGHATTCSHHKVTQTTVPERASTHMRTSNKNHIPTVELCVCVPSPNVLHNPQTTHTKIVPTRISSLCMILLHALLLINRIKVLDGARAAIDTTGGRRRPEGARNDGGNDGDGGKGDLHAIPSVLLLQAAERVAGRGTANLRTKENSEVVVRRVLCV